VIIAEFNVADGGLGDIVIRGYRFLHPELLLFGVGVTVGMAILLDRCLLILRVVVGKWA
jgi:ABC-type proline/glycine betaine transport system permease subunit